jgi:hypothetical protein
MSSDMNKKEEWVPDYSSDEGEFLQESSSKVQAMTLENDFDKNPPVGTKGTYLGIHDEFGDWLSVPGFPPDRFRVSTKGFIQNHLNSGWTKPDLGHQYPSGYRRVGVQGNYYYVHVLTCTAFYGVRPDKSYTPQHGPGGKGDNSIENLKGWATPTQQANEYKKPRRSHVTGKPIFVWKIGTPEDEAVLYPSVTNACKATGVNGLSQVANGKARQAGVFRAKWAPPREPQDDFPSEGNMPAEQWREVTPIFRVSNRGRAWHKYPRGDAWGHKYTPVICTSAAYAVVRPIGSENYFHRVVFNAFFPGVLQGRDEVDHIDQDRSNNQLHNLRKATRKENSMNRTLKGRTEINNSRKKPVRGRPVGTTDWVLEKGSHNEAAEALSILLGDKVHQKCLSKAVLKGRSYKGWEFESV